MLYRFDEKMLGWRSIKKAKCIWNLENYCDQIIRKDEDINEESKNICIEFYEADKFLK